MAAKAKEEGWMHRTFLLVPMGATVVKLLVPMGAVPQGVRFKGVKHHPYFCEVMAWLCVNALSQEVESHEPRP